MSSRRLVHDHAVDLRVVIGGLPSPSEVAEIVGLPANWSVEFHRDPAGATNIALVPDPVDDAVGPTLVIYWDGPVVRLDSLRWDAYTGIGGYSGLNEALATASRLIRDATAMPSVA